MGDSKHQQDMVEFENIADDPNGGAAVTMQSPEVKTTKCAQPQSHGKQTNIKKHFHNRGTIWDMRSSIPQVKR
jgi:hypothetical protein